MDISERINRHEQKKKAEITPAVSSQATKPDPTKPVENRFPSESFSQATQAMASTDAIDSTKVELRPKDQLKGGVDWRSLDYDSAIKFNPSLSRSQYISGAAAYRKENDKPGFTDAELYTLLGGKDPFISAEQEQKNERRMKAAGYVDAIGGVLANLVNYIRTTRGNPAMNLSSLSQNTARLDKLKAYHDALGRQNFGVYMDMLEKQRALEAAAAQAENKFRQQIALEQFKQNSPYSIARLNTEQERAKTEQEKRKGIAATNELTGLKTEQQRITNKYLPGKLSAQSSYYNARAKNELEGTGSGKKKQVYPKVRIKRGDDYSQEEFDLNKDVDVLSMYREGAEAGVYPPYKEVLDAEENDDYDLNNLDVDLLRNIILYQKYNYITPDDKDYNKYKKEKSNSNKPKLGWGTDAKENKDNDLDW